jgi:uncharacterized membrane protein
MSELISIVYPYENTAGEVRSTLVRLQKEHLIELDDAVAVIKGNDGTVRIDQAVPLTSAGAASGAISGGLWGTLIGMLFFAPLLGFAVGSIGGAIGGAVSGKMSDYGIDDELMKQLGAQFQPGSSALFVLVRKATPDKVLDEIKQYGGKVLRTSLTRQQEEALQAALTGQETGTSNA